MDKHQHYLEEELYSLMKSDDKIFDFLQESSLDGLWYWDIENPEHEWMNDRFWEVLGYDPKDKQSLSSEWNNVIFSDDLLIAMNNFDSHCKNPDHPTIKWSVIPIKMNRRCGFAVEGWPCCG